MENMKIVLVSQKDFDFLWLRLSPQERVSCEGLPMINLLLAHKGMLMIPKDWVEVKAYECPAMSEFTLKNFFEVVGIGK